ncbi:MAG: heavy metal-associated domain-containing protein [Candidatus Falkowbacteria bacterium]
MNNLNIKVAGMTCEACAKIVSRRFSKVPGVTDIKIDLASGDALVSGDANLSVAALSESLLGTEFSISK